MEINPVVIGIVVAYLGLMVYIGFWASRRISTNEDFMVAGRRLGPWMLAGTLAATEVGGGSSLGVAEKAYGSWGLSAGWYVLTMSITFFVLAFVAPRLRDSMVKTVPEYFRRRYGKANGLISAVMMSLPMVGFTAVQMIASATILSVMTGWSYTGSVLVVAFVVTAYSVMGGLWGVTVTDVVQWILIVGGVLITLPFALRAAGGWESVVACVPREKLSLVEGAGLKTIISLIVMYVASFAVGQETVQRYFAARNGKAATQGSLLAGSVYVVFAFIPALLGVIAYAMVRSGSLDAAYIEQYGTRYVLPTLAIQVLPPVVVGLLFAALISATMSSADSDMLAAGSIISNDIYAVYLNPRATDRQVLRVTRLVMVLVGGLSLVVALTGFKDIITILIFSFTLRAGGAFVPYIAGHYWRKASPAGCLASLLLGSLVVILAGRGLVPFFGLEPIFPGLVTSVTVFMLFTALFPRRTPSPRAVLPPR